MIYLISWGFFAWTFLNFLARCVAFKCLSRTLTIEQIFFEKIYIITTWKKNHPLKKKLKKFLWSHNLGENFVQVKNFSVLFFCTYLLISIISNSLFGGVLQNCVKMMHWPVKLSSNSKHSSWFLVDHCAFWSCLILATRRHIVEFDASGIAMSHALYIRLKMGKKCK